MCEVLDRVEKRGFDLGLLEMPTGPYVLLLSRFGFLGPKCGSRNAEKQK